jgi:hypothetical protein
VGVGFTQFEFTPSAHKYIGIAFAMSIPDVPSPKLTIPSVLDVNVTVSGAAPDVGEAVNVAVVVTGAGVGFGVGIGGHTPAVAVAPPGHAMPVPVLVTVIVTVPSICSLGVLQMPTVPSAFMGHVY